MRRLRGSAPSGIPVRCGGFSSLRRLRRSAPVAYFIFLLTNRDFIFYAQAAWIRALWRYPCAAAAPLLCAGGADPHPPPIL